MPPGTTLKKIQFITDSTVRTSKIAGMGWPEIERCILDIEQTNKDDPTFRWVGIPKGASYLHYLQRRMDYV
jgi:hypothetical protein